MKIILSLDPSGNPAGHTGIVLLGYDDTTPAHSIDSWAVQGGVEPFREWVWTEVLDQRFVRINLVDYKEPEVVICEKFVPRNIPGADYTPLVMEGVIQWLWPGVIWSPASGKDKAVPNEILKHLGLYDFGMDHHHDRREAARHAVRHLKVLGHKPTLKAGWAPSAR